MQCVPRELWPSSLLWRGDASPFAEALSKECCRPGKTLSLTEIDAWRRRVDDLPAQPRDDSAALMLICLADQYRELDMPSQALECSQTAERYLNRWAKGEHRQNHAVAEYALGLALEDLDRRMEALRPYGEALKGFRELREWWMKKPSPLWRERCDEAIRWIEQRTQRLAAAGAPGRMVPVPVVGRIVAGDPMLAEQQWDEWILVDVSRARRVSFALRVTGESMIDAGIAPGSLVLIEQNESFPPNGTTVAVFVDQHEAQATLKKFYQESDHIRLEAANAAEPIRILKSDAVNENRIHVLYGRRNPGQALKFYSVAGARIVGWMRDVIPN